MVPKPFRIKLLRGIWDPTPPGSVQQWPWSSEFCEALTNGPYEHSLRAFWWRNSFGVLDLQIDGARATPLILDGLDGAYLLNHAVEAVDAVRQRARDEGETVDGYDGTIVLIHPPPSSSQGWRGGTLLDQNGRLEHFQHETGHLLGFQHAFGADSADADLDTVYDDPYCVMGDWSQNSYATPPPEAAALVSPLPGAFWRTSRRLAAANLFRTYRDESAAWWTNADVGDKVILGAASALAAVGEPLHKALSVVHLPGPTYLTIEYRVPSGDDRWVTPGLVVHTIGYRPLNAPGAVAIHREDRPIWFEGMLPAVPGRVLLVGPYEVRCVPDLAVVPALGPHVPTATVQVAQRAAIPHASVPDAPQLPRATVPALTGRDQGTAVAELTQLGFRVFSSYESSDAAAGTVLSQDPEASTSWPLGWLINLVVSQGSPVPGRVPDLPPDPLSDLYPN